MFRSLTAAVLLVLVGGGALSASGEPGDNSIELRLEVEWGVFDLLAGDYWIQSAKSPLQYLHYEWEVPGLILGFEGLDNDGTPVAGQLAYDPDNSSMSLVSVRKGQIASYDVQLTSNEAILFGQEAGVEVRQIISKRTSTSLGVEFQERRNGKWVALRSIDQLRASEAMVKALGWIEKNPEFEAEAAAAREAALAEQPGFFRRLSRAIQDGIVVGAEDGVREGVHKKVVVIIDGNGNPSDDDCFEGDME